MTDIPAGRLHFLDQTLQGMIERFEREYPETRLPTAHAIPAHPPTAIEPIEAATSSPRSRASSIISAISPAGSGSVMSDFGAGRETSADMVDNEDGDFFQKTTTQAGSRRGSMVDLASRAQAFEEGRMLKLGQRFRREVLPPVGTTDYLHGTSDADPEEPEHLATLRASIEELGSDQIRATLNTQGLEAAYEQLRTLQKLNIIPNGQKG